MATIYVPTTAIGIRGAHLNYDTGKISYYKPKKYHLRNQHTLGAFAPRKDEIFETVCGLGYAPNGYPPRPQVEFVDISSLNPDQLCEKCFRAFIVEKIAEKQV